MKFGVLAWLILVGAIFGQERRGLSVKGRIDLPDVEGRIDHLSPDIQGYRLFVGALGNRTVEILSSQEEKWIGRIPNLAEPQGVYYDSTTKRLFVACAADGTVKTFEAQSFQLLATANFSSDSDNLRYDARRNRIVVGYGDGGLGFLDPNGKRSGELALDAHPESFRIEQNGRRAFVNVPDKKEIEAVDLEKSAVLAKWPVTSALQNYPMALDETHHRLLIGCRAPARMLVFDTETGKQTSAADIVADTDDIFYDAVKSRVYVIGGGGFVDVFEQRGADQYSRIGRYQTAAGARTGLYVPEWGELFIAVPHRGAQKASVLVFRTE